MSELLGRRIKVWAQRVLRRQEALPPVIGVADADWYDAAFRLTESYSLPFWQSRYYFLWSVIADRIRAGGMRHVLDIGCGPGQLASCLMALTSIESYTGLDFSPKAIAMAKRTCPAAIFTIGDATTTTVHHDVVHDVVVCTEVLEHVPADLEVITKFRPGIRCLCTVPNFPYSSHVRHFQSAAEVLDRYGAYFDRADVWALQASTSDVFFLLDGVRNDKGH